MYFSWPEWLLLILPQAALGVQESANFLFQKQASNERATCPVSFDGLRMECLIVIAHSALHVHLDSVLPVGKLHSVSWATPPPPACWPILLDIFAHIKSCLRHLGRVPFTALLKPCGSICFLGEARTAKRATSLYAHFDPLKMHGPSWAYNSACDVSDLPACTVNLHSLTHWPIKIMAASRATKKTLLRRCQ